MVDSPGTKETNNRSADAAKSTDRGILIEVNWFKEDVDEMYRGKF